MKHLILWSLLLVVMAGCGGRSEQQPTEVTVPVSPTSGTQDAEDISPILSLQELQDDSIFIDGSKPTSWENAGITDVKGLKLFLKDLQQAIITNNKEKLAAAVKYPLQGLNNAEELIDAYDNVFTKDVKMSFALINFSQIFRNQQGAMTEGGRAWIGQFGNEFKIFAINQ